MAVFKNFNEDELIIDCDYGCDQGIHFKIADYDNDNYMLMTFTNGNYYKEQGLFLGKLKKIWAIIRNKDFYYSDVVLSKVDFEQFKEWINRKS